MIPDNDLEANDKTNIFDRLNHGDIITSVCQRKVPNTFNSRDNDKDTDLIIWIEHDQGGWSPSTVNGVQRLIPIIQQ